MTSEQFAYWMQGFVELHGEPPNARQWEMIKDHLRLVFNKVTPSYPPNVVPWSPTPMTPSLPDSLKWLDMRPQCVTTHSVPNVVSIC